MSTTVAGAEYVQVPGGALTRIDRPGEPSIELPSEPLILGRAPQCGVALDESTVSWTHAELSVTPRGVCVRDLGSRNGTWVDGLRVAEIYLTRPARLSLGNVTFQFAPGRAVQVETGKAEHFGGLIGSSSLMKELFYKLGKVAKTELTTLITGPSGTGKEGIARAIHEAGPRAGRPYVVIDCARLSASLAESELFGHERAAFTGAERARPSPFVEADGGTIFLDEIGELATDLQPKLLRVLQERSIKPVGANAYRPINVRIIAATWRELEREINKNAFRSDLYFRLAELHVDVPALRDRPDDVPFLIEHFARQLHVPDFLQRIPDKSLERIMRYGFPGNVRELKNIVSRALTFAEPNEEIAIEKYCTTRFEADDFHPSPLEDVIRTYWKDLHKFYNGNISKMARAAGMGSRETVRNALERYGISESEE